MGGSVVRSRVLPFLIWLVYVPLRLSWRVTVVETDRLKLAIREKRPLVLAHWHGDELGMIYMLKRYHACAMTSTSKDGELINGFLRLIGVQTARGSSTRGGVSALKGILRLAKNGYHPSVAVDGPKGPRHKPKPGVFEVSKLLGAEIHPLAAACSSAFVFKRSWNQAYLPLPFAKIVLVWGEPVAPLDRGEDAARADLAEGLARSFANAEQQARNLIAANQRRC